MRDSASEFIAGIVLATAVCWIVYTIVGFFRRREQLRVAAALQTKLLERVESVREFGELLNSEGGRRLMDTLATEQGSKPQERIILTVQVALLLMGVGVALFLYMQNTWEPDPVLAPQFALSRATVAMFGTMAFGAGLALLIGTRVAYTLSKRMGLTSSSEHTDVTPDRPAR